MKITNDFCIQEFVPKKVFQKFGDYSIWFMDKQIILFSQYMRDRFGPVTVNDWSWGGHYDSRGYRTPDDPDGTKFSQHRFGRAVDLVFKDAYPDNVRKYIQDNFPALNRSFGITTIEDKTPSWVHVDKRWTNLNTLFIVPYK